MTVACRMMNCPHNNENICSAHTILINPDGRCFDLLKGFRPEEAAKIRNEFKLNIEDVDIVEKDNEYQEHQDAPPEDDTPEGGDDIDNG